MQPVTLIWHRDPDLMPFCDWIRYLSSDVVSDEVIDPGGQFCRPWSIVLEDNRSRTPASFFEAAAAHRPIGLFHVGDEYLAFDYTKYRYFDFVIKMWWSPAFEVDRVLMVPLGYQSDLRFPEDLVPASQRPLLWSFAGAVKASRYDMVRILRGVTPNVIHATAGVPQPAQPLNKAEYVDLLAKSAFCACPMGNVSIECFRLYESLEAGCIPIVETRPFLNYYARLLKNPPLLFVRSWREAKDRMLELAADPAKLDAIQRRAYEWWQRYKAGLKDRVVSHVRQGFTMRSDAVRAGVRVKRVRKIPGWHYVELLRHQSIASLRWRVERNLLGGRLKVPFWRAFCPSGLWVGS